MSYMYCSTPEILRFYPIIPSFIFPLRSLQIRFPGRFVPVSRTLSHINVILPEIINFRLLIFCIFLWWIYKTIYNLSLDPKIPLQLWAYSVKLFLRFFNTNKLILIYIIIYTIEVSLFLINVKLFLISSKFIVVRRSDF